MNVKRLHENAILPKYAHDTDSGFDLHAIEDTIIEPGETALIKTGLAFDIPKGYEIQIRPRSGVTLKTKLRVQLGTIDSGYRGEVGVIVDNIHEIMRFDGVGSIAYGKSYYINGKEHEDIAVYKHGTHIIKKGYRIAQGVIAMVVGSIPFTEVDNLTESDRGSNGYGSTGV